MAAHVCSNILIERLLDVDHLVELWRSMEDWEVDDKGIALASDNVLSDHSVGAWIGNLREVEV